MKDNCNEVDLSLLAATFCDVRAWKPSLHQSLELDYLRARRIVTTRGMSFLYEDMPKAGKVLDKSLSFGRINSIHLPPTFGKRMNLATKYYLNSLFRLVFDDLGCIREDVDPDAIFFLRQVLYLYKSLKMECSEENISSEIDEFAQIEARMRRPTLSWASEDFVPSQTISVCDGYRDHNDLVSYKDTISLKLLKKFQSVCDLVVTKLPILNTFDLRPGHGPGAVSDLKTGLDKYSFPSWSDKLENLFPMTGYASSSPEFDSKDYCLLENREVPARLYAVPKTPLKPRLIASEPVSHQYCQKALMRWIRESLPSPLGNSIDFLSQDHSKRAVLTASKNGKLSSVDLSSASDRLSCWVVERVFRKHPEFLRALHATRSRVIYNDSGLGSWRHLLLRKFAHQGSSVTFPIQTIIYALASYAAILYTRGEGVSSSNLAEASREVRVYGDDILISSDAAQSLFELLTYLGLKINMGKTHTQGLFRESCGMDAYNGVDVTPLYLSYLEPGTTPERLMSWVEVSNNAYRKGLWFLSSIMVDRIRKYAKLLPITGEPLACITLFTYQAGLHFTGRKQMCKHLHRQRILALQVATRTAQGERSNSQNLLQFFVEEPEPTLMWSSGYSKSKRILLRKRWVHV
jgi:hypothetical protein